LHNARWGLFLLEILGGEGRALAKNIAFLADFRCHAPHYGEATSHSIEGLVASGTQLSLERAADKHFYRRAV